MTLTEFLEARITDDERHAHKLAETDRRPLLSVATTVNHPQRLLAECAAKRAIIAEHPLDDDGYCYDSTTHARGCKWTWPCATLRVLASIYADHPDYRDEWGVAGS